MKPQKVATLIHHLPGLNGIRAIAALAVVFSHATLALKEFGLDPHIFGTLDDGSPRGLSLAGFGVSIFFVLSGFLITYLLCLEEEQQKIDVKKFYLRRALRIWPLYYLYLIVVVALMFGSGETQYFKSLPYYFFFAANIPFIINSAIPLLSHYWSLGVEEQFYLFWPWLMKAGIRKYVWIIAGIVVFLISLKLLLHFYFPGSVWELAINVSRFHCMLIGSFGAILFKRNEMWFIKLIDNKVVQLLAWIIIGLTAINKFHIASVIDNEIIAGVALIIIVGQVGVSNRLVNLDLRPFDFIGRISYGIYVVHPVVIHLNALVIGQKFKSSEAKYIIVYFLVLSFTILISYLSYIAFEKFFLLKKKKFQIVKSSDFKT